MRICLFFISLFLSMTAVAVPDNIAPLATVTASSFVEENEPSNAVDGIIRVVGKGNWRSSSKVTFWGEIDYPWIQLDWKQPVTICRIVLYSVAGTEEHIASGVLKFSDGTEERVLQMPAGGAPKVVEFAAKTVSWVKFEATDGDGACLGLSEIEVIPSFSSSTTADAFPHLSYVDPAIETTRGRYFFFVTGSQPFGMIGAAPLTRNKNQDGGGYNYNSRHILGFPQLHGWMLSGLNLMPVSGDAKPELGIDNWRSRFSHDGEVMQPAYHRLYLDDYNVWVEQTAADRASLYRLTYCEDSNAGLLVHLGGYISTTTMTNAHVTRKNGNLLSGYFDTVGRLWGGPDRVRVYFVVETSRDFDRLDSWEDDARKENVESLNAADSHTPRNSGMSYSDAPSSGMYAHFRVKAGEQLLVRTAVSYVSEANALDNLRRECPDWEFDSLRKQSQSEWENYFSRISVEGGSEEQRVKFYTDLWHTLLGRHKIDDACGQYPDYTECDSTVWKNVIGARLKVRQLPMNSDGKAKFHIYNSDALWLSQWNLNILWGLAYPEVLDDFAAAFLQYSLNGGLLARGPNLGGYSFIMSGCPATSLIASAYQQGLTRKWNPQTALREMRSNHLPGGMQGWGEGDGLKSYIKNGYCPDKAGLTIQWAFEDYALGEMAAKMGKKSIAREFLRRSHGWTASLHPDHKLVLPRRADGSWLHTDLLNGWGYEEANAWQATFGLSHDIDLLAEKMGGQDSLCARLDYAFRQAATSDFGGGYGSGYVNYANQPGLSNAHVFNRAGKPWLSQYWVRQVRKHTYGGTTPDLGYGGHDEDQGQMASLSALMSIGLFSLDGCVSRNPHYDITSPIFDTVTIRLNKDYYPGEQIKIVTHNNSEANCYIQSLSFNGTPLKECLIPHSVLTAGGTLDIYLGSDPKVSP